MRHLGRENHLQHHARYVSAYVYFCRHRCSTFQGKSTETHTHTHARTHARTHTHTRLTALCPGPGLPGSASTRKVKPIWILLKQETASGSVISWAICKSAPRSRQITMPAPHHSVFYRPDALLPPNQQRQSIKGKVSQLKITYKFPSYFLFWYYLLVVGVLSFWYA